MAMMEVSQTAAPHTMSAEMKETMEQNKARLALGRQLVILRKRMLIVEESVRGVVEGRCQDELSQLHKVYEKEWEATAAGTGELSSLKCIKEARTRRWQGKEKLLKQRDRAMNGIEATKNDEIRELNRRNQEELDTLCNQQEDDVRDLPEGEGWKLRDAFLKHTRLLKAHHMRSVAEVDKKYGALVKIENIKWSNVLVEYSIRADGFETFNALLCSEERERGHGVPWRRKWWGTEPDHIEVGSVQSGTNNTSYTFDISGIGIEGEEARAWCLGVSWFHNIFKCLEQSNNLTKECVAWQLGLWKWQHEELKGIQRKELKRVEHTLRSSITTTEGTNKTRREILRFLYCDEEMLRVVLDEHETRVHTLLKREEIEISCSLWKWLGIRWILRKDIETSDVNTRYQFHEAEDRSWVSHCEDHASTLWFIEKWYDHRRVKKLEIELQEEEQRRLFQLKWDIPVCVIFPEGLQRVVMYHDQETTLKSYMSLFDEIRRWLERKWLAFKAFSESLSLEYDLLTDTLMEAEDILRLAMAHDRWLGVRAIKRKAAEIEEAFYRCPVVEEMERFLIISEQRHTKTIVLSEYWQGKHSIERKALEDVEEFIRCQNDDVERAGVVCEEHLLWGNVNESYLNGLHVIERCALQDVEGIFRWQLSMEAEGFATKAEEWATWRLLMLAELAEKHRIQRYAFERAEIVVQWQHVEEAWERALLALYGEYQQRSYAVCLFVEHHHAIERNALCDVEAFVRAQLCNEGYARHCLNTEWRHLFVEHMDEFWQIKHDIQKKEFTRTYLIARLPVEETMVREHYELRRTLQAFIKFIEFMYKMMEIERAAFEDTEGVVRWQGEAEYTRGLDVVDALQERDQLTIKQIHELHVIEKLAVEDVEMVVRWQGTCHEQCDVLWLEQSHGYTVICNEYWITKHALQRLLLEYSEDRHRETCIEDRARVMQTLDEEVVWCCVGVAFLAGKHIIERNAFALHEDCLRQKLELDIERETIELEEHGSASFLLALLAEAVYNVQRRGMAHQEGIERYCHERYEELAAVVLQERQEHILAMHTFMIGMHKVEIRLFEENEERTRFKKADAAYGRAMVELESTWGWRVAVANFITAMRHAQRVVLGGNEACMRILVDEGSCRRIFQFERAISLWHESLLCRKMRYETEMVVLLRMEREARDWLKVRLHGKWEQLYDAVKGTLSFFGKKEGYHSAERSTYELDAVMALENIELAERTAHHNIISMLKTSVRMVQGENITRVQILQSEKRNFIGVAFAVNLTMTSMHFRNFRNLLQRVEDEETARYRAWRQTSPNGLLRLFRASPHGVKSDRTPLQGLRYLKSSVFGVRPLPEPKRVVIKMKPIPKAVFPSMPEWVKPDSDATMPSARNEGRRAHIKAARQAARTEVAVLPPSALKLNVNNKCTEFHGVEGGLLLPKPIVFFTDTHGKVVTCKAAFTADHGVIKVAFSEGALWELCVVPMQAGSYEMKISAKIDSTQCTVPVRVAVTETQPEGISNGAWKLFRLLQDRTKDGTRVDQATRTILSGMKGNSQFVQLKKHFGNRHPWLLDTPTTLPPRSANLVPIPTHARPKLKSKSPEKRKNKQLPPLKK